MDKTPAIFLTDGSLESAVVCAIVRQKHDVILIDVSDPEDAEARQAVGRQIEILRPRQTHSLPPAPVGAGAGVGVVTDDPGGLLRWTAILASAAPVIRQYDVSAVYVPLRVGVESETFGRAAEFLQIWEELYRHALALGPIKLSAPLLEMQPWQAADLAHQMNAPTTPAHGEAHRAAFVQAGRAMP